MNRSLSFGYNAVASIGEIVAERLVQASFADGSISETITSDFILDGSTGIFHALITNVAVEFGAGAKDRIWLQSELHVVLEFPMPPAFLDLANNDWMKATVRVKPHLTASGAKVSPNLASLSVYDVLVQNVSSNNPTLQNMAWLFLSGEIVKAFSELAYKQLELDLGFDPESLKSDAIDAVLLDGPPPEDRDELALAFYRASKAQETRGGAAGIQSILAPGKSLTVRVSKETVDELMKDEMDQQYLRFDLKLGDQKAEDKYGVSWGKTTYLAAFPDLGFGKDDYYLKLSANPKRSNLRDCTVTNLRTGEVKSFDATSLGESTNWNILVSEPEPIYMHDLKNGDVLRFHGEYKLEKKVKIYYPAFELGDGKISLSATAVTDVACYDDVEADIVGKMSLSIDPATGDLSVKADEPDIDLPGLVDLGLGLLKGVLYAFTGPFASLIISGYTDSITSKVEQEAKKQSSLLLPTVSDADNLLLFWEGLAIKADGVILQGQIEAGWLSGGDRSPGLEVGLDSTSWVSLEQYSGQANTTSYSLPPDLDDSALVVVNKAIPFEKLGPDDLKTILTGQTANIVAVPTGDALEGLVLAVRTASRNYAKVRVDRSKTKQWVLRWITYKTPSEPKVCIVGSMKPNKDKSVYVGKFSVKAQAGIYDKYGLDVKWFYSGPGKTTPAGDAIWVEVDFEQDSIQTVWFLSTLKVQVTDIFGRQAKAETKLSGTYGEEYVKPLPEAKHEPGPGEDGELVKLLGDRGLAKTRIRQMIQFVQILRSSGINLNEALGSAATAKPALTENK
jgi:hypothetical protein